MVLDGLRGYLQLANGLTDVTRERALVAARTLVAQSEASVGAVLPESLKAQVGSLTDDLIAASKANRALLLHLVGVEIERTTARLGLAFAGELEAAERRGKRLEQRVAELERELRETRAGSAAPAKKTTKKSAAKKSAAKKSPAKKSPAPRAAAPPVAVPPVVAPPVVAPPVVAPPVAGSPVAGSPDSSEKTT